MLFIDYGYFFDSDGKWYYIIPEPFRIKLPMELVYNNLDENNEEFGFKKKVRNNVLKYIINDYIKKDEHFKLLIKESNFLPDMILKDVNENGAVNPLKYFFSHYKVLYEYFDDWIVIKGNDEMTEVIDILVRPYTERHKETIDW